jgi:hypothetical protein
MVDISDNAFIGSGAALADNVHVAGRHIDDHALEFFIRRQHKAALHVDRHPLKGSLIWARDIPRRLSWLE